MDALQNLKKHNLQSGESDHGRPKDEISIHFTEASLNKCLCFFTVCVS
jgi:hypothetical protein